jgi:hypothetical protein
MEGRNVFWPALQSRHHEKPILHSQPTMKSFAIGTLLLAAVLADVAF